MYNYGCTGISFEANQVLPDTIQYALHAGGQGFDSPHLHHETAASTIGRQHRDPFLPAPP